MLMNIGELLKYCCRKWSLRDRFRMATSATGETFSRADCPRMRRKNILELGVSIAYAQERKFTPH
jgi:hypothetical protein